MSRSFDGEESIRLTKSDASAVDLIGVVAAVLPTRLVLEDSVASVGVKAKV